MKKRISIKHFIKNTFISCSALLIGCKFKTNINSSDNSKTMETNHDSKNMAFCCAECNDNCQIYKATLNNDLKVKKLWAEIWTQEVGEVFSSDQVFCYGCKKEGVPQNNALINCTVRKCAIEKQFESCAQCSSLEECDKDLWKNWPNAKIRALTIQQNLNEK